jgi:hypothetical protein
MTELEMFKILTKSNTKFTESNSFVVPRLENAFTDNYAIVIDVHNTPYPHHIGYADFISTWIFDKDGNFIATGASE